MYYPGVVAAFSSKHVQKDIIIIINEILIALFLMLKDAYIDVLYALYIGLV